MNAVATQPASPQTIIKTPGQLQNHIIGIIQDPRYAANFDGVIDRQSVVIAMMHIRQNWTYLSKCKPDTIIHSLASAGAYGWTCDPITGHAYIVPFGDTATLIPGYRGLMDLVHRAGQARITAEVVYEGDVFANNDPWSYPLHRPSEDIDRKKKPVTHVYAVAKFRDGDVRCWVMSHAELIAHRNQFCSSWKLNQRPSSLWHESNPSFAAMCRKTVIIKAIKSGEVPISLKDKRGQESLQILDETETPKLAEPLEFDSPAGYAETLDDRQPYTVDSPGDEIASDAAKHLAEQTPAQSPESAKTIYLRQLAKCKTVAEVDQCVSDAMNDPEGDDIREEGEQKKAAMTFLESQRTTRKR